MTRAKEMTEAMKNDESKERKAKYRKERYSVDSFVYSRKGRVKIVPRTTCKDCACNQDHSYGYLCEKEVCSRDNRPDRTDVMFIKDYRRV
jgi:hypothetical protein